MNAKPIIFSGEMVRAILSGKKTMTRRVIKPQPDHFHDFNDGAGWRPQIGEKEYPRPYQVGMTLWVRETFCVVDDTRLDEQGERWVDYRATPRYAASHPAGWENAPDDPDALKWRPSIHMPRWASRLTLEITEVRVERLTEISDSDAMAEGVYEWYKATQLPNEGWSYWSPQNGSGAASKFRELWDNINGKRPGCSWADDPFVWVISFRKL